MTLDRAIEIGVELLSQVIIIRADEHLDDTANSVTMNVLGVSYRVRVPKHEWDNEKNIRDAWLQIFTEFGVFHKLGSDQKLTHGARDLTDEELAILGK